MKRHHKWFRKERYKQKLERSVDKHHTYFSNVYFTTDEPDPRHLREDIHMYRSCGWWKETDEEWIEKESHPRYGKDYFIYYKRPKSPTPFATTTKMPDAVSTRSSSNTGPPAVCVKDGSSMVKCISTTSIAKQRNFGGNWTDDNLTI